MLLGAAGFFVILAARRGGDAIYWNKWLMIGLARWVQDQPAWVADAARDVAALASPTVLAAIAVALVLGMALRRGAGPALGLSVMLGLLVVAAALLKAPFADPQAAAADIPARLLAPGFPSAPALFAGVLWARFFGMLNAGVAMPFAGWLLAAAACAARVDLGAHLPSEAAAGLCAALVALGVLAWAGPAPERAGR